ncbi:MAG TPA: LptF/LptG family permease [Vicinamibacterales bacterium]|nr:LptF/LptG family permease [Vicinamibacterales bacterium]
MLRILDRYVLRELVAPFAFALLLLTFALEIPTILQHGETLISEGVSWGVVVRVLATLLPSALGITIPMSLLVGILYALGRLSGDREIVAMEACGVSLGRLLRPLILFALLATAATAYVMIVMLPAANQAFREITFKLMVTRGESRIKPRVFYSGFPNLVIRVREVMPGVGWTDVMVAESSQPAEHKLYLAKRGHMLIDEGKRSVALVLEDGTQHSVNPREPDKYLFATFDRTMLVIDPETVFPREGPMKGLSEMTIAELKGEMAALQKQNTYPHNQIMAWQRKYSIPAACLAFMLVALGMGVSSRRDGRLASFVLGIGVVFVYWVLMYMSEAIAKAGLLPYWFAWLAMWVPNAVIAVWGAVLIARKLRGPERSIQLVLPVFRRVPHAPAAPAHAGVVHHTRPATRIVVVVKLPRVAFPHPSILDWYVLKQALWVSALSAVALLALFYIATFIDLSDHLFKGRTTAVTVLSYLWFASPQFLYYLVPLAVLMGALVTIGALTKNSELVVMKACGISLYRAAAPLVILALIGSTLLIGLEERLLAYSNRHAEAINNEIRGRLPMTQSLDRRWVAATNGKIYQYLYFEPGSNRLNGLSIYEFGEDPSTLTRRRYFDVVQFRGDREARGQVQWQGGTGWQWEFNPKKFTAFTNYPVVMEGPGYFASDRPDAEHMSYGQLSDYVTALEAGGFNVVPYVVSLHRKLAFPFVTLIMALIAVPFAVSTGKHGAMYGVGAGIVLAILYWTAISVFGAIGAGGLMAPALAAWAPNILFGCAALYLLLTVRT